MPLKRRVLPGEQMPGVADIAGLSGALAIPGAIGGVLGKAIQLSAEDAGLLHELLGKPIQLGKRLLRLSSVNPEKGTAILHDATSGSRIATPIKDFLHRWRTIGQETEQAFPEGIGSISHPVAPGDPLPVMSQRGVRAEGGSIGPKGGLNPARRKIPPTATR